jgi:(2Fe-2S) ferredoxin
MTAPENTVPRQRLQILVCDGPSCGVTHESEVLKELLVAGVAADPELTGRVHVVDYMCFGRCSEGPNMFVRKLGPQERAEAEPDATAFSAERGFYPGMDAEKCRRVLALHCKTGVAVADLVDDY